MGKHVYNSVEPVTLATQALRQEEDEFVKI
jgi:hypothetical protein